HRAVRLTYRPGGNNASAARDLGHHGPRHNWQRCSWRESERCYRVGHCLGDDGARLGLVETSAISNQMVVGVQQIHALTGTSAALGLRTTSLPRPAWPVNSPSRMTTSPRLMVATG